MTKSPRLFTKPRVTVTAEEREILLRASRLNPERVKMNPFYGQTVVFAKDFPLSGYACLTLAAALGARMVPLGTGEYADLLVVSNPARPSGWGDVSAKAMCDTRYLATALRLALLP